MKTPTPEMMGGNFAVCNPCKEAKFEFNPPTYNEEFISHHSTHGPIEIVTGPKFLSEMIKDGYIDVDNPDLEPLYLGPTVPQEHSGLQPGGTNLGVDINRKMRHEFLSAEPDAEEKPISIQPATEALAPNLDPNRPLLIGISQSHRDPTKELQERVLFWWAKFDVGVPTSSIEFNPKRTTEIFVEFSQERGKYIVHFPESGLESASPDLISKVACEVVVVISSMQRFGNNAQETVSWLTKQITEIAVRHLT